MDDRTDWPVLDNFAYRQLAVTIDQHPKPRSIRARVPFYASHIADGKPLPCAYAFRNGETRITTVAAGFLRDGELYYATIARNKQQLAPYPLFVYWRWGEQYFRSPSGQNTIFSTEWAWYPEDQEWREGEIGCTRNGNLPPFNQPLWSTSTFSNPINPRISALIQCYLWTEYFEPVQPPVAGPPGMPWPPMPDGWWANAFTDTSEPANQRQ